MDKLFWVIVGAILSLLISMAVKYYDDKITKFLDSTRFYRSERSRKKAMAEYRRILAFKEGRRDIHLFATHRTGLAILSAVFCAFSTTVIYLLPVYAHFSPTTDYLFFISDSGATINRILLLVIALAFMAIGMRSLSSSVRSARRLENFEEYKNSLIKKWGSVDEPKLH
jgi:hypothetical protein